MKKQDLAVYYPKNDWLTHIFHITTWLDKYKCSVQIRNINEKTRPKRDVTEAETMKNHCSRMSRSNWWKCRKSPSPYWRERKRRQENWYPDFHVGRLQRKSWKSSSFKWRWKYMRTDRKKLFLISVTMTNHVTRRPRIPVLFVKTR